MLVGGVGQVEVRVDRCEGIVEIVFPEGDIVFVCRGVCEGVRYGPVVFGDVYGYKVAVFVEDAS